ncbi:MAG: hypothetical protein VW405_22510 [Rhodospirillaceae bacterium]
MPAALQVRHWLAAALLAALPAMAGGAAPARAGALDALRQGETQLAGSVAAELRLFPHGRSFDGQDRSALSPSVALAPEVWHEWHGGDDRLTFVPFLRLDAHDENRTHWNIREANWLHLADTWDMTVGVG